MRRPASSICTAALAASGLAHAGSLGVGPTRIDLDVRTQVQTLTVQNTGDTGSLIQVDVKRWQQSVGGDVLTPATEIVATPRVFELKPGETRSVRVGLRVARQVTGENAYRVYVREVQPVAAGDGAQLRYLMQVGIPVFVSPVTPVVTSAVNWNVDSSEPGCSRVQLINDGQRRERVLAVDYRQQGQTVWRYDVPQYLLAGTRRAIAGAPCIDSSLADPGELIVHTESGEQHSARVPPGN